MEVQDYTTLKKVIRRWVSSKKKIVIGLDGTSGSGKTTLLQRLARDIPDSISINTDEYSEPVDPRSFFIHQEPEEIISQYMGVQQFPKIKERILQFKSDTNSPVLFVDGTFLFHPAGLANYFDKWIFLDVHSLESARKRQEREEGMHGDSYDRDLAKKYEAYFSKAFDHYINTYTPQKKADIIITNYLK